MTRLEQAAKVYFETGNLAPLRRAVVGQAGEFADAARAVLKGGRHDGPCRHDDYAPGESEPACSIHLATYRQRYAALLKLTERAVMRSKVA